MQHSGYRTDKNIKNIVRDNVYDAFARWQKEVEASALTYDNSALILPGPGAPEIDKLKKLGYSDQQIVAVDTDADCLKDVVRKAPGAHVIHMDVLAFLKFAADNNVKFNLVNLDLMGCLSDPVLDALKDEIPWCLSPKSVLAITYQRGREKPTMRVVGRDDSHEDYVVQTLREGFKDEGTPASELQEVYRVAYTSTTPMSTQVFERGSIGTRELQDDGVLKGAGFARALDLDEYDYVKLIKDVVTRYDATKIGAKFDVAVKSVMATRAIMNLYAKRHLGVDLNTVSQPGDYLDALLLLAREDWGKSVMKYLEHHDPAMAPLPLLR